MTNLKSNSLSRDGRYIRLLKTDPSRKNAKITLGLNTKSRYKLDHKHCIMYVTWHPSLSIVSLCFVRHRHAEITEKYREWWRTTNDTHASGNDVMISQSVCRSSSSRILIQQHHHTMLQAAARGWSCHSHVFLSLEIRSIDPTNYYSKIVKRIHLTCIGGVATFAAEYCNTQSSLLTSCSRLLHSIN